MTRPQLSLCLPTLDRGDLFPRTLRSLAAQEFEDFEIVVIDNASKTDDALRAVEALGDPRVRYFRQPARVPMGENWNTALGEAKGEFVAVCHDDDVYHPRFAAETVGRLAGDPSLAFVHTAALHVDESGYALAICDHGWPERVSGTEFRRRMALDPVRSWVEAQTVVARRSAYDKAGPFIREWIQATDADMWVRLAETGDVGFVRKTLVTVRLRTAPQKPSLRHLQALKERVDVATRAMTVLPPAERLLARARLDAVVLESLAWTLVKAEPEVADEARPQILALLSAPTRALATVAAGKGEAAAAKRVLGLVAQVRRRVSGARA